MGGSEDRRRLVAERVLRELATDAAPGVGPEVIRDGAAYLVRRGSVLVRVRPADRHAVAVREVRMAETLADLGVPVTRLVRPQDQPWVVDEMVVTAWRWVATGQRVSFSDVGLLARLLRERAMVAAGVVTVFDPLGAVRDAVAHLDRGDRDVDFVLRRADELHEPWEKAVVSDPLGRSVVHGDLHRGNVVAGSSGVLLTDLELIGRGPASYDAAPTVLGAMRYGMPRTHLDDFFSAFGADPRNWEGFDTYRRVYELWVTAWAVGTRHLGPVRAEEATRRIESLRDGIDHRWQLL